MRDILETDRIEKPRSAEIVSRLEENAETKHEVPTYKPGQEKVLKHTIRFEEKFLNDRMGKIQVEFYENYSIEAVGDSFIIEKYFPGSSYE